jgi:hypothetical protein
MFRSRWLWLLFILGSAACAVFAYALFPAAFPLVTLDIEMDRALALDKSRELAERFNWGPSDYRQAASFGLDQRVQNFVELEAGGTEAFRRMLSEELYSPYTWRVRHFKEGETLETSIRFTPSGKPYDFVVKLPEDMPGPDLSRQEAQSIAERTAREHWSIDFDRHELVEASREIRPGGRVDHRFVYRRRDAKIGDAEYRLRLVVGGDQLTELRHFVKIPEAFSRRYAQMRSANDTIAVASSIAMVLLYIIGGCVIGLFFLLRKRWVLPRQAFLWGFFISGLQVFAFLNRWPLLWMGYDTALSSQSFIFQQLFIALIIFLGWGLLFSLTFMAAEGLTRRAFGHHIRLWEIWSRPVAGTASVAGRTIAGYLLVSVFFTYEVLLYFSSSRWLDWWSPSSALFNPDILATYFPWLGSVATSLQAGFWEECLFRAVPIAGAALIGQRFGKKRMWIFGAVILQAVIFGGAHANYPAQPAYARMVELIIPSIFFALVYLFYGLLPAIVLHFAFDVAWFAMPLFVSAAPGIRFDQLMVILLTLVPLWVVLWARWRNGRRGNLSEEHLNRTWKPPEPAAEEEEGGEITPAVAQTSFSPAVRWIVLLMGVASLIAWPYMTEFRTDSPPFSIDREQALDIARQEIESRGIFLPRSWQALSAPGGSIDARHRFVWQEGGKDHYRRLFGSYLPLPHWWVRFAKFKGDVAERAEEYRVYVEPDGKVVRFSHLLPEGRPGARLNEESAREHSISILDRRYGLADTEVEEISATPRNLPNRDDWTVTFADRDNYPLEEGEARVAVRLGGDEVVDTYRWIHVPEEWLRRDRERATRVGIVSNISYAFLAICMMAGVGAAIVAWSHGRFDRSRFLKFLALLVGIKLVSFINNWPTFSAQFSTTQPLEHQWLTSIGGGLLNILVTAAAPALIVGFVHQLRHPTATWTREQLILLGLSLGVILACLATWMDGWTALPQPSWSHYTPAGATIPLFEVALAPMVQFVLRTAFLVLVFGALDRISNRWTCRRMPTTLALLALGLSLGGLNPNRDILSWLIQGVVIGMALLAAYILLIRFEPALIPLAVGMFHTLSILEQGLHRAFTAALPGAGLAAILIIWMAIVWSDTIRRGALISGES